MGNRSKTVFDLTGVLAIKSLLEALPAKRDQVIARTISGLVRSLPVQARRDMQSEVNLSASRIYQDLSCTATATGVQLTGYRRGIGLTNFPLTQSKNNGITARVYVQGSPEEYPHAFIAAGLSGNKQVFARIVGAAPVEPKKGRYAGMKKRNGQPILRQPIKAYYGPTIAALLGHGDREERLADFAQDALHTEAERLLDL